MSASESPARLDNLIFYKTGPMSFHEKRIPPAILKEILNASTSCAWLGRWRLLSVTDKNQRVRVVEVWQSALRKIGRPRDANFIERWKVAPLFIAFCQLKSFQPFQWVPAEYARVYGIQEVGAAVRSIELKALENGIGLHGIMGLLLPEVGRGVQTTLEIPEDHELVFFGIMGYPKEEVENKFPKLEDICYADKWGGPFES